MSRWFTILKWSSILSQVIHYLDQSWALNNIISDRKSSWPIFTNRSFTTTNTKTSKVELDIKDLIKVIKIIVHLNHQFFSRMSRHIWSRSMVKHFSHLVCAQNVRFNRRSGVSKLQIERCFWSIFWFFCRWQVKAECESSRFGESQLCMSRKSAKFSSRVKLGSYIDLQSAFGVYMPLFLRNLSFPLALRFRERLKNWNHDWHNIESTGTIKNDENSFDRQC